jgi:hypothetical protein
MNYEPAAHQRNLWPETTSTAENLYSLVCTE